MDHSNAAPAYDDLSLRITSLTFARDIHHCPNGYPENVVEDAQRIYRFLTGQEVDPGDGEHVTPDGDKVIQMADAIRKLKKGPNDGSAA